MAKMRVHELAKELGRQNKELIAFLQDKGYEVKVSSNSIGEEEIALARKEFGAGAAQEAQKQPEPETIKEEPKTEAAKEEPKAEAPKETPKAEPPKETPKNEAPKKKKIIFVNNPENSRMSGQRQQPRNGGGPNRNNNTNRPSGNGGRPVQAQNAPHKIIRPTQKPLPVTAEPYDVRQRQQQERRAEQLKKDRDNNVSAQSNRQAPGQSGRPAAGQERNTGAGDNRRPEGQNRKPYNNDQENRKNSANGAPGSRNGANNERPQRGNGGQDNRFRKNNDTRDFAPETSRGETEKHRDDEKRRSNQDRDKRSKKDLIYEDDDAAMKNRNKAGRFIKPEKKAEEAVEEQIKVITVPETITIRDLADKMKIQASNIIKKLFMQGKVVTLNSEVSFEDAENIAIEYDIICEKEVKVDVIEELLREDEEDASTLVARPPVICVMGHVDHGKTSLLDAIRKTNVTDKEAGGITQAIGAYTVSAKGQSITFLDTPGHEAFTAMRMRGANATDIAVLVVAADDGVMPQTVEAINHAKAAGIEIIVAVNKIDKPNANIDRVKQEMTEYELIPVDWGGSTEFVPVSAKSGEGIDTLLETILLTAEILELKANPNRNARGLVIEAQLDKGRGPVATVLVQKGTLHVGDFISAGASHGKVRAMIDDKGRRVKEAKPSTPVEILGLSDVPSAGEVFIVHENDKTAKSYAETYRAQHKEEMIADTKSRMSLDDLFSQIQEGNLKELNLIVKADVQGSVEALKQSLLKLSNEEVVVKCIHGGVGAINESDVSLASASSAIIIGFNVRPDVTAKAIAEREGVDVRLYKVIYQAIEDIEAAMKGMLDPIFEEKVIGHAEVRQIFKASAIGNIAGSYVTDGEFQRGCKIRITRGGEQIYEGSLASLKRFKDDVKEVKAGYECGLVFEGFDKMQELDVVEAYIMVEVPR
jgi:translation initiation factor IF-2